MFKVSILIFINLVSFVSYAEQASQKVKRVDAKCHVELYGGTETIYFRTIKSRQLEKLAKQVLNRDVLTPTSSGKKKVYKVHECVLLENTFKTSRSNQLDAKTAR